MTVELDILQSLAVSSLPLLAQAAVVPQDWNAQVAAAGGKRAAADDVDIINACSTCV